MRPRAPPSIVFDCASTSDRSYVAARWSVRRNPREFEYGSVQVIHVCLAILVRTVVGASSSQETKKIETLIAYGLVSERVCFLCSVSPRIRSR